MRIWKLGVPLAAVLIFALTPAAVWGQNVYGTIAGTVTDSSGAAIGDTTRDVDRFGQERENVT